MCFSLKTQPFSRKPIGAKLRAVFEKAFDMDFRNFRSKISSQNAAIEKSWKVATRNPMRKPKKWSEKIHLPNGGGIDHGWIPWYTLPETNSSPLKMMVSKFGISKLPGVYFRGVCCRISGRLIRKKSHLKQTVIQVPWISVRFPRFQ